MSVQLFHLNWVSYWCRCFQSITLILSMLHGQLETWSVADSELLYGVGEVWRGARKWSQALEPFLKFAKKQAYVWVSSAVVRCGCFRLPGFCRPGSISVLWDLIMAQLAEHCTPATDSTFQHPNSTGSWFSSSRHSHAMWIYFPTAISLISDFHPVDHYIVCSNKTELCKQWNESWGEEWATAITNPAASFKVIYSHLNREKRMHWANYRYCLNMFSDQLDRQCSACWQNSICSVMICCWRWRTTHF